MFVLRNSVANSVILYWNVAGLRLYLTVVLPPAATFT